MPDPLCYCPMATGYSGRVHYRMADCYRAWPPVRPLLTDRDVATLRAALLGQLARLLVSSEETPHA